MALLDITALEKTAMFNTSTVGHFLSEAGVDEVAVFFALLVGLMSLLQNFILCRWSSGPIS